MKIQIVHIDIYTEEKNHAKMPTSIWLMTDSMLLKPFAKEKR